jgi:hypothetical protein
VRTADIAVLRAAVPQRPQAGRDQAVTSAQKRVLINFSVDFCMKAAQAKHNEALGMRVHWPGEPAVCAVSGGNPTTDKCQDQPSCE